MSQSQQRPEDDRLQLAPETVLPESGKKKGFWGKLKRGLLMTHSELIERLDARLDGRVVLDEETLEYLEETLIATDLGVATSLELVEHLRQEAGRKEGLDGQRLKEKLASKVAEMLATAPRPAPLGSAPVITLMVGVNGVGKTTSIAKLARHHQEEGKRVLLAAADTFRAAAIEQLTLWGQRLEVEVVRQRFGADPAAVIFDALQAGRARAVDHVIADTAGRLHTKDNLMAELAKIDRVIDREAAGWQRRTLLVLDATTGQNAITQAREFMKVSAVDGVFLTKLDGTAKGGMAVAVAKDLSLPILFLGVGEGADDMVRFDPKDFAKALFA